MSITAPTYPKDKLFKLYGSDEQLARTVEWILGNPKMRKLASDQNPDVLFRLQTHPKNPSSRRSYVYGLNALNQAILEPYRQQLAAARDKARKSPLVTSLTEEYRTALEDSVIAVGMTSEEREALNTVLLEVSRLEEMANGRTDNFVSPTRKASKSRKSRVRQPQPRTATA